MELHISPDQADGFIALSVVSERGVECQQLVARGQRCADRIENQGNRLSIDHGVSRVVVSEDLSIREAVAANHVAVAPDNLAASMTIFPGPSPEPR